MTTKEYLRQGYRLDARINSKLQQIDALRNLACKATTTMSLTKTNGGQNQSRVEECIVKIVDLSREVTGDIDALVDLKRSKRDYIERVENPEYKLLLDLRYFSYYTWDHIAMLMHYDVRHIHRLHGDALNALDDVMKCHS